MQSTFMARLRTDRRLTHRPPITPNSGASPALRPVRRINGFALHGWTPAVPALEFVKDGPVVFVTRGVLPPRRPQAATGSYAGDNGDSAPISSDCMRLSDCMTAPWIRWPRRAALPLVTVPGVNAPRIASPVTTATLQREAIPTGARCSPLVPFGLVFQRFRRFRRDDLWLWITGLCGPVR